MRGRDFYLQYLVMILATHAITGALLAQVATTHPEAAFGLGFISHFALDALPHWDYQLASEVKNESDPLHKEFKTGPVFWRDLVKIGGDCLVGCLLVLGAVWWLDFDPWLAGAGLVGALVPDALQFAYAKLGWRPLKWLQAFHQAVHTSWRLTGRPLIGLGLQISLVAILFSALFLL